MDNNESLITFHETKYKELLYVTAHRDHFRNAELVPVAQKTSRAVAHAIGSAQQALCRYDVLQGTALCPVPIS